MMAALKGIGLFFAYVGLFVGSIVAMVLVWALAKAKGWLREERTKGESVERYWED